MLHAALCTSLRVGSGLLGRLDDGDEATSHSGHDDGRDQRSLSAVDGVAEVGCHATKAEEEDAGAEEQDLLGFC